MKFIENNKPIHKLINWLTLQYTFVRSTAEKKAVLNVKTDQTPIWITGIFRSGTSVTTQILEELGVDLGPSEHLLKAKGDRANWNPGGFYENHLFMDWSLSIFEELDSWGHIPPSEKELDKYDVNRLDYKRFLHESIVQIHDDRISNLNKSKLLRGYFPRTIDLYFQNEFKVPFGVKNPHFSVLEPVLSKYWPSGRFLVVFRSPDASIGSAQKIAQTINYDLYIDYYQRILSKSDITAIYFSYDHLMSDPEKSIIKLAKVLKLDSEKCTNAQKIVQNSLNRHSQDVNQEDWPIELKGLYSEMLNRSINS